MNRNEIGKQRLQEIIGQDAEAIVKHFESVSPDFASYVVNFAYGDLYTREGFSDKNRELAAVACLIGQGNTGLPLKAHLRAMLNVGWKKEDVEELLIFLIGYAGFPSCVDAIGMFKQVLEEIENG